jgi:PAS domain S-box-containing protein
MECTKEQLVGRSVFEFSPPESRKQALKEHADFSKIKSLETYYLINNKIKILFLQITPLELDGDTVLIGIGQDITERKRAEDGLHASEQKHRRLFETMSQGVIYQAADGTIISANPAAERILGLSFEQMQGKTSMDPRWKMIFEDGTDVSGTDHPAMIALCTGETVGPVVRGVFHPDKHSHVWLSITAIPLFQPGETKPFQVYATFEDITDRKRLHAQLSQLQKSESLGRMAGAIAHHFNNNHGHFENP